VAKQATKREGEWRVLPASWHQQVMKRLTDKSNWVLQESDEARRRAWEFGLASDGDGEWLRRCHSTIL
jgi:hypothetical protein